MQSLKNEAGLWAAIVLGLSPLALLTIVTWWFRRRSR